MTIVETRGRRRPGGFTLIELLITVTVLVLVMGFAVGPFQSLVARMRLTAAVNSFVASVSMARTAAVMGHATVTFCADDHGGCGSATDWPQGALLFNDLNGNHTLDRTETITRHFESNPNITILADDGHITFDRDGTVDTGGASALRWVFCDPAQRAEPRLVSLRGTGANHLYQPADCTLD